MAWLRIFDEKENTAALWESHDASAIAAKLLPIGIRYEVWETPAALNAKMTDNEVLAAYASDIERLKSENGYQSVDIVRVLPDNPKIPELRQKFLQEHTHAEDEVRFFVEGAGMFYLRTGGHVYMTLCERGDLIGVPHGVRHWFDMGPAGKFTAIRLFTNPEGWVANFTGDSISSRFPAYAGAAA